MTTPVAARVQKRRESLRKAGLRPIQLWVPDTRAPAFARECRRQSALLRQDAQERSVLRWIDAVADTAGWE